MTIDARIAHMARQRPPREEPTPPDVMAVYRRGVVSPIVARALAESDTRRRSRIEREERADWNLRYGGLKEEAGQ